MNELQEQQGRLLTLDESVYPCQAVMRAAYWMAEDAVISIDRAGENKLQVILTPRPGRDVNKAVESFRTAIIDFSLRVDIEARTADLRNLIWRTAFSEAKI